MNGFLIEDATPCCACVLVAFARQVLGRQPPTVGGMVPERQLYPPTPHASSSSKEASQVEVRAGLTEHMNHWRLETKLLTDRVFQNKDLR